MEFLYRDSGSSRRNDVTGLLRMQAQRTGSLGTLVGIMMVSERERLPQQQREDQCPARHGAQERLVMGWQRHTGENINTHGSPVNRNIPAGIPDRLHGFPGSRQRTRRPGSGCLLGAYKK